jgi:hypothetical protein
MQTVVLTSNDGKKIEWNVPTNWDCVNIGFESKIDLDETDTKVAVSLFDKVCFSPSLPTWLVKSKHDLKPIVTLYRTFYRHPRHFFKGIFNSMTHILQNINKIQSDRLYLINELIRTRESDVLRLLQVFRHLEINIPRDIKSHEAEELIGHLSPKFDGMLRQRELSEDESKAYDKLTQHPVFAYDREVVLHGPSVVGLLFGVPSKIQSEIYICIETSNRKKALSRLREFWCARMEGPNHAIVEIDGHPLVHVQFVPSFDVAYDAFEDVSAFQCQIVSVTPDGGAVGGVASDAASSAASNTVDNIVSTATKATKRMLCYSLPCLFALKTKHVYLYNTNNFENLLKLGFDVTFEDKTLRASSSLTVKLADEVDAFEQLYALQNSFEPPKSDSSIIDCIRRGTEHSFYDCLAGLPLKLKDKFASSSEPSALESPSVIPRAYLRDIINCIDKDGNNVLHAIATTNIPESVRDRMLDALIAALGKHSKALLSKPNKFGRTPIHVQTNNVSWERIPKDKSE